MIRVVSLCTPLRIQKCIEAQQPANKSKVNNMDGWKSGGT
jgi:hypothetical protein